MVLFCNVSSPSSMLLKENIVLYFCHKQQTDVLLQSLCIGMAIGHVSEYPTMHYFGNPRHTQSMIAYMILSISGKSSEKLYCRNVANVPYHIEIILY